MKKFIKIFAAVCLAAGCFVFAGCDTFSCPGKLKEVKGYCYLHRDCDLKLPVKIESGRSGEMSHQTFSSGDSLEKIKSNVEKLNKKGESYSAKIYGDKFLFIEKHTNGGKVHYYILTKLKTGENGYHFRCPVYDLLLNEGDNYSSTNNKIYVPAHLLDIPANEYEYVFDVVAGSEYKLCCEKWELIDFYRKIDEFAVNETQDGVTVSVKEEVEIYGNSLLRGTFAIDLKEKEDGVYAEYRVVEE